MKQCPALLIGISLCARANGKRLSTFTSGRYRHQHLRRQDRLLTHGTFVFSYGANGELESKTDSSTGEVWVYHHDVLGNLLSVLLPNGDLLEYLVDARHRRVGKKINGSLVRQWLCRGKFQLAAELDGTGRFGARDYDPQLGRWISKDPISPRCPRHHPLPELCQVPLAAARLDPCQLSP